MERFGNLAGFVVNRKNVRNSQGKQKRDIFVRACGLIESKIPE